MSSLQHSTPQSLPHDYAILSHFNEDSRPFPDVHNEEPESSHPCGIPIRQKGSVASVSERTPLLRQDPPIPCIHETVDENVCIAQVNEPTPSASIFREELGILVRYSLPVFGCVADMPPFKYSIHSLLFVTARIYSSTPSFLHPS